MCIGACRGRAGYKTRLIRLAKVVKRIDFMAATASDTNEGSLADRRTHAAAVLDGERAGRNVLYWSDQW